MSRYIKCLSIEALREILIQNKTKNLLQELFNNKAEHTVNKHIGSHNNPNL